jgi:hypothetical protein
MRSAPSWRARVLETLVRLVEAVGLRAVPGLVNLTTVVLIGGWLSAEDYGVYSLILATTGFAAAMAFGPLTFAVVAHHAKFDAAGQGANYESSVISAALLIAACLSLLGILAAAAGLIEWAWFPPAVLFGLYTAVQEVPHARLRLWTYGFAALAQALVFLALSCVLVPRHPSPDTVLIAFAMSYGLASAVSLVFVGRPTLRLPDKRLLADTFRVGGPYTISTAIEQTLYLGMRYLILLLGTPHHLGVFSFCVDTAQRLGGFLINAAAFVTVPTAFRNDAQSAERGFAATLLTGAALAGILAIACSAAVIAVWSTGQIDSLSRAPFDPVVFAIVTAAVVLNRVKKIVVDPFAMRALKAAAIAMGYAVSAPITLALGYAALQLEMRRAAEIAYVGGYALAGLITVLALRPALVWARGTRR